MIAPHRAVNRLVNRLVSLPNACGTDSCMDIRSFDSFTSQPPPQDGSQDLADALDGDGWDDDDVPRPSAKKKVEDSGQLARARAAVVKPKQQGMCCDSTAIMGLTRNVSTASTTTCRLANRC